MTSVATRALLLSRSSLLAFIFCRAAACSREGAIHVEQRLELFLFLRVDAEHEDQDHRAEAATNAVEEGEAEDLSLAAANHVSGQDLDGLTSAPRVALASSQ